MASGFLCAWTAGRAECPGVETSLHFDEKKKSRQIVPGGLHEVLCAIGFTCRLRPRTGSLGAFHQGVSAIGEPANFVAVFGEVACVERGRARAGVREYKRY